MRIRKWLRPPRHLLLMFFGTTLLLVSTLGWFGWRVLRQDRALATQRVQKRIESSADRIATALELELERVDATLAALMSMTPEDLSDAAAEFAESFGDETVVVTFGTDGVDVHPQGRITFYPDDRSAMASPSTAFTRGESLEFRTRDYVSAAGSYQRLTRSADSVIRAGAMVRLARVLRKANQLDSALSVYRGLSELESVAVGGLPSGLVGRFGELSVLAELDSTDVLREGAEALVDLLGTGRWRITRAIYLFYSEQAAAWIPNAEGGGLTAERLESVPFALAEAVESLWDSWSAEGEAPARNGGELFWSNGRPVSMQLHGGPGTLVALVGGPGYLREMLDRNVGQILKQQRLELAFSDTDGRLVLSQFGDPPTLRAVRTSGSTGLPWNLEVAVADMEQDLTQLAERRRLLMAGLFMVVVLSAFGTYAVARAVNREAEVARLQSDFVAAVSHEFRTPLTTMRQLIELLASGRVDDQRRQEYYAVVGRETNRLQRLVEGLLDFARFEAGAHEFSMQSLSPDELAQDVVDQFRRELAGNDHAVSLETGAEAAVVAGDREALGRALWNLLDNAVKYSPEGGDVSVATILVDGKVAFRVSDTGIGIPAVEREKIFQKFVRGPEGSRHNVKGTGLGLAMVQEIARAHGGAIEVSSEEGRGSTFTLSLPVEKQS